jgi:hypothetical protein
VPSAGFVAPMWLEYCRVFGPILVAVVAALIASIIQYRSWKTARDKLRFDLFEKRISIYYGILDLIDEYFLSKNVDEADVALRKFDSVTRGHEFLFDDKMNSYIYSIREIIVEILNDKDYLNDHGSSSDFGSKERSEISSRFSKNRQTLRSIKPKITKMFSRFLSFENISAT